MKRRAWRNGGVAACVYLLALGLMWASMPKHVHREAVQIAGPNGKPCLGTVWTPRDPRAVILMAHGVTSNQSVMATTAKAFARNGYIVVTFDFWGHGLSREKFSWASNPSQIHAWCDWTRATFPGKPLAYIGHSMGGFSGADAFVEKPEVDAFVALGALPLRIPICKTLIAAGRFEELFDTDDAVLQVQGKASVITSPFSDHVGETWDPVLLGRIVAWVDATLGIEQQSEFPWGLWAYSLIGTLAGLIAALMLAEAAVSMLSRPAQTAEALSSLTRGWSLNPYRLTARLLGYKGNAAPPRSGSLLSAILRGVLFSAVFIVLLSFVLNGHMFTCGLLHPERLLMWLVLMPFMTLLFALGSLALERVPLPTAFARFAVAALTRCIPLLVICLACRLGGHGDLAFCGMMLGIVGLILVVISAIQAMATRGAGDYRAGVVASGVALSWVAAFWLPLMW